MRKTFYLAAKNNLLNNLVCENLSQNSIID